MNTRNWRNTIAWLLLLLVSSCVEPYSPEVLEAPNAYLVVNGFINVNGPTTIQLLRTQNISEETPPPTETGALVLIESETGESYKLQDMWNGNYKIENLNLSQANKYRLYIRTANGKEYASEFVEVKQTPAIDEVTWKPVGDEVQIYISTHDPNNNTRYYRWEYEETWHFRSAFYTSLVFKDGEVKPRTPEDGEIFNCWKSGRSSTVEVSNSVKLSQDVISNYKLLAIPHNSAKVAIKYSLLAKQYAMTREAYEYWEALKKNTESIGTLFDPLPSQLPGNIRCLTEPQEPVIGFVSATTMQQKRMFVDSREFPKEWRTFRETCPSDTFMLANGKPSDYFEGGYYMPVDEIYAPNAPVVIGYTYASRGCVDCTTRGTNVKPDFWE